MATEAEVKQPGDFVTVEVGPWSVIVVRDDEGQVRAHHNVCRHRGSRVLAEERGSVGTMVCGYHQWTYGTDGTLLHAGEQAPGFDPSCFGLKSVAVRAVEGLVFISLAAEPPADFDDVAARHGALPRAAPAAPDQGGRPGGPGRGRQLEAGDGEQPGVLPLRGRAPRAHLHLLPDLRLQLEELPDRMLPLHARYLKAQRDLERTCDERGLPHALIEEIDSRPAAFRIAREPLDGAGESYTTDGSAASTTLLGDFDTPRLGRLSLHHQPNSWFHFLADHAVTFTVLPLGPDKTLVRTTWLVHEDAVEGVDYDLERLTEVWHQTNAQDGTLVGRAQAGVTSPAYEAGPYAPNEYQVEAFVAWYVDRLKEHLS